MKKIRTLLYSTLLYSTLALVFLSANNGYCSCSNHPRAMYVDCAGDFIVEAANGNTTHLDRLLQYAQDGCFSHLSLFKLDGGVVFGNAGYEATLSDFIVRCHNLNITVGVVGSTSQFFTDNFISNPTWTPDYDFFESFWGYVNTHAVQDLGPLANPRDYYNQSEIEYQQYVKAEMIKFYLHAGVDYNYYHIGKIDVLSLEDEYWSTSGTPSDVYTQYSSYIDILTSMNTIKTCSQQVLTWSLIIEAELGDLDNGQLVQYQISPSVYCTPEYQAEHIDNLTDRILLVSYNYYPTNLFTRHCQWINLLGQTTKANTVIWPLFSAEAYTGDINTGPAINAFNSSQINQWNKNSCNAGYPGQWSNYLGDFIIANSNTGLSLVEDQYFQDYNSAIAAQPCSTCCQNCSCPWDNGDNANITTVMWFTYTLLDDPNGNYHSGNPEYKLRPEAIIKNDLNYFEISPNPSISGNLKIKYFLGDNNSTAKVDIVNLKGELNYTRKLSLPSNEFILNKELSPGIYFCRLTVDGKETDLQKLVIMP